MNKIVKILLVILAALIIAGAGFWGGTQFAYRQVAANTANLTVTNPFPKDGNQRGYGMMGPQSNNRGWSGDNNSDRTGRGQEQVAPGGNEQGNRGPRMMQPNNFGSSMMNRSSGRMFGGGLFGGGLMLLGLLFPLGLLVLMVLGIIILFRMVKNPANPVVINNPDNH